MERVAVEPVVEPCSRTPTGAHTPPLRGLSAPQPYQFPAYLLEQYVAGCKRLELPLASKLPAAGLRHERDGIHEFVGGSVSADVPAVCGEKRSGFLEVRDGRCDTRQFAAAKRRTEALSGPFTPTPSRKPHEVSSGASRIATGNDPENTLLPVYGEVGIDAFVQRAIPRVLHVPHHDEIHSRKTRCTRHRDMMKRYGRQASERSLGSPKTAAS